MEESEENELLKYVGEIRGLETTKRAVIDDSAYSRILSSFNSAIMCSPKEEACSELLKILDRLEERVFKETEEQNKGILRGFSVFAHQHHPSTLSSSFNSDSFQSFSTSTSLQSPEPSSVLSELPKKSTCTDMDVARSTRYHGTARKLESSFVECSDTEFECTSSQKKSAENSSLVKNSNIYQSSLASWIFSKSTTEPPNYRVPEKSELGCKPLMLVSKPSRLRLMATEHGSKRRTHKLSLEEERMVKGSLQCQVRDGIVTYNLWLDETEELLVAKEVDQDISEDMELCDKVFIFSSYRCMKGKPVSWMNWGRKEKPVSEVIGKMKVFSTVIPEMDGGGRNRHFLDSDFVIMEARKEQVVSTPMILSSRRLSFSSWDATPSESPRSSDSPLPVRSPSKWPSFNSLLRHRKPTDECSVINGLDSESIRISYTEVGAVVTRVPIEVKRRSNSMDTRVKRNATSDTCEKMNVTVVVPAGEHGGPSYGLSGPQPLLERYRDGGACDCGSWDLGCGLLVLENEQNVKCSAKAAQEQSGSISVVMKGKKREVILRISPLYDDDIFSVSFRQPLSTLQAFGAVVAVLHSQPKPEGTSGKGARPEETIKKNVVSKLPLGIFHEAMKIRRVYSLGCHPESNTLVERV